MVVNMSTFDFFNRHPLVEYVNFAYMPISDVTAGDFGRIYWSVRVS